MGAGSKLNRLAVVGLGVALSTAVGASPPSSSIQDSVHVSLIMRTWPDPQGRFEAQGMLATRVAVSDVEVVQGFGAGLTDVANAPEFPRSLPAGSVTTWAIRGRATPQADHPPPVLSLGVQFRVDSRVLRDAARNSSPGAQREYALRRGIPHARVAVMAIVPKRRRQPLGPPEGNQR